MSTNCHLFENAQIPLSTHQLEPLPKLMHRYLLLLKCVGLYHYHATAGGQDEKSNKWFYRVLMHKWKVYSALLTLTVLGMSFFQVFENLKAWMVVSHGFADLGSLRLMSTSAWAIRNGVMAVVLFTASRLPRGFHALYLTWGELRLFSSEKSEVERSVKVYSSVAAVVCAALLVIEFTVLTMSQRSVNSVPQQVIMYLEIVVHTFCVATFVLLCAVIAKVFSVLNARVVHHIRHQTSAGCLQLSNFYHNYFIAVDLVDVSNCTFNFVLGVFVLSYIVQLLTKTFSLFESEFLFTLFFFVFWWSIQFAALVIVIWMAALVHEKAHESASALHKLPWETVEAVDQLKLISLQNYLGGSHVYFSLCNFRKVDKSILLTIFSIYATYLFILIQFHKSGSNLDG